MGWELGLPTESVKSTVLGLFLVDTPPVKQDRLHCKLRPWDLWYKSLSL